MASRVEGFDEAILYHAKKSFWKKVLQMPHCVRLLRMRESVQVPFIRDTLIRKVCFGFL